MLMGAATSINFAFSPVFFTGKCDQIFEYIHVELGHPFKKYYLFIHTMYPSIHFLQKGVLLLSYCFVVVFHLTVDSFSPRPFVI